MSRILTRPRNYFHSQAKEPKATKSYDDSGQIFTEQTYGPSPMGAAWTWKARGSPKEFANFKNPGPGAANLWDLALRMLLLNLDSLTQNILQGMPLSILERLWEMIKKSELDTFQVWKAFVSSSTEISKPSFNTYARVIPSLETNMLDYAETLNLNTSSFVTGLTIWNVSCSKVDLINISRITNLTALVIGSDMEFERVKSLATGKRYFPSKLNVGLDDRIVRSWSRAAQEAGAFARLRVFVCRGESQLTNRLYKYLQALPSLCYVSIDESEDRSFLKFESEWESEAEVKNSDPEDFNEVYRPNDWVESFHDLIELSGPQKTGRAEDSFDGNAKCMPFFASCIGAPPSTQGWSYIRRLGKVPTNDIPDQFQSLNHGRKRHKPNDAHLPDDNSLGKRRQLRPSKATQTNMTFLR